MTRPAPDPLKIPTPPDLWGARTPRLRRGGTVRAHHALPRTSTTATHVRRGSGLSRSTESRLLGWERSATVERFQTFADLAVNSLTPTAMRSTQRLDFLVPVSGNDDQPFSEASFAAFEDLLVNVAGGFTRRGDVTGAWRSPSGQLFRDRSRSYSVTVPADRAEAVASTLHRVITDQFRQEAVLIEATPTLSAAF